MQKFSLTALVVFSLVFAGSPSAQDPAVDPADRLREALPADVAGRVLARISQAKEQGLPAEALVNRALKFVTRGIPPADIERSVNDHASRLEQARNAILEGRRSNPSEDEVEAGAEALRMGVDGAAVSALARSAPSGRSLEVPLFVIGSLVDRGLPSDQALQRVLDRLQARATDRELEQLPGEAGGPGDRSEQRGRGQGQAKGQSNRPEQTGAKGRPASVGGGRPASIPANPGKGNKPDKGKKPDQ